MNKGVIDGSRASRSAAIDRSLEANSATEQFVIFRSTNMRKISLNGYKDRHNKGSIVRFSLSEEEQKLANPPACVRNASGEVVGRIESDENGIIKIPVYDEDVIKAIRNSPITLGSPNAYKNAYLREYNPSKDAQDAAEDLSFQYELQNVVRYIAMGKGKQLLPILAVLCGEYGYKTQFQKNAVLKYAQTNPRIVAKWIHYNVDGNGELTSVRMDDDSVSEAVVAMALYKGDLYQDNGVGMYMLQKGNVRVKVGGDMNEVRAYIGGNKLGNRDYLLNHYWGKPEVYDGGSDELGTNAGVGASYDANGDGGDDGKDGLAVRNKAIPVAKQAKAVKVSKEPSVNVGGGDPLVGDDVTNTGSNDEESLFD